MRLLIPKKKLTAVQVALTPAQYEAIAKAAAIDSRPLSRFMSHYAWQTAKEQGHVEAERER